MVYLFWGSQPRRANGEPVPGEQGMKWIYAIAAAMLLASAANGDFTGKVTSISDGDTMQVMRDGQPVKVRMNGIDAPEKGQAHWVPSKQFLSTQCFGRNVKVVEHGLDKYGRTIGDVYLDDDTHINLSSVANGHAWWYREYAAKAVHLADAEAKARAAQIGLWTDEHPVAPWDWRHAKKKPATSSPSVPPNATPAALGLVGSPSVSLPTPATPASSGSRPSRPVVRQSGSLQTDSQSDQMAPDTASNQSTHWLTTSSGKRHNTGCRYYKSSKGRPCGSDEGTACKVCGG
jgi:micrococcal nuclease